MNTLVTTGIPMTDVPDTYNHTRVLVTDVSYNITDTGRIFLAARTDPILPPHLSTPESEYARVIVDHETLAIGDNFEVSNTLNGDIFWKYLGNNGSEPRPGLECDPEYCPCCYEHVMFTDDGIYCINDLCPARIKSCVYKFLIHNYINCTAQEQIVLDGLIYRNTIQTVADLFTIHRDDILQLGSAYSVQFADELIYKIQHIRGTMSLSQYLCGLNIELPATDGSATMRGDLIDTHFPDIFHFFKWLTDVDDTPNKGPEPYMSQVMYQLVSNYFSIVANVETAKRLHQMGIFSPQRKGVL